MPKFHNAKTANFRASSETINELMRGKQKRDHPGSERGQGRTELSAACKKGTHKLCFALNCKCECGHGDE